ncbi:MAG: DUF4260 domain-containing protein [Sandaracinaceae bacterium]|nr:DUF4260 domain-containing protein [Sandaracinaceae bacterium]
MTPTPANPLAPSIEPTGAVRGAPRVLLRLEGAAVLVAASLAYAALGGSWGWFAALFLVPDLSMLGYLAGPRVGAALYDAGHSTLGPAILGALAYATGASALGLVALVWVAHVGFDRALGYGLKYATSFADTHLGRLGVGRARAASPAAA